MARIGRLVLQTSEGSQTMRTTTSDAQASGKEDRWSESPINGEPVLLFTLPTQGAWNP